MNIPGILLAKQCSGLVLLSFMMLQSMVNADVIFSEGFSPQGHEFEQSGRVYSYDGYVRLRGGGASLITSPAIDIGSFKNIAISYDRETRGLDAGETLSAMVSVDGGEYQSLETVSSASGRVSFPLEALSGSNTLNLRFSLEASSYFERADLGNVVIEGDPIDGGCDGGSCCNDGCQTDDFVTIVPDSTWDCGMPNGIPDPQSGELLFTAVLPVEEELYVGMTPFGWRTVMPLEAGDLLSGLSNFNGGEILPGSLDFQLSLPSGAKEHESRFTLRMEDGDYIYMRNCGVADGGDIRFVSVFEAGSGSDYTKLHDGVYVGTQTRVGDHIEISVYRNPKLQETDQMVQIPEDNNVRQQAWECPVISPALSSGAQLLEARVNIGSFQTVGESRFGSRRMIPITGGTFEGSGISGDVIPGGADYQLTVDGELQLEARYVLRADNGEIIVVRNCGDFAKSDFTIPQFEANVAGEYHWLNAGYFAGDIVPGFSRVTIRVYERQYTTDQ